MSTKTVKSKVIVYAVLSVLAIGMIIPFFWMVLASFKTSN